MERKPVLIVESSSNGLILNESASIPKQDKFILSGIFTEFDVKNRNERIYTKERFLPHLDDLNERIRTLGAVYGEFDHPDAFDISLSRISHVLEGMYYNKEKNRVDGSIRLLSTHYGKEAKSLILDNCPIFVSSRAAGVTESDGTVTVKKLFTYDAVADPGFSSARMEVKSLNESLGFNESANFRVYDMSDESKINEIFTMNNNDQVTKKEMIEYTDYLTEELQQVKKQLNENMKLGNNPEEFIKLSEYYETLHENHTKMTKYLDYLADNIQVLVSENTQLKQRTDKLIEHNDYLAENLEKSINSANLLAEKIDKSINYSEYIAESLNKSIDFSEYIAENVDKSIKYSEYLAETLDKSIDYSEYISEHTEFNIQNYEMLSEYVDNSIKYSEYVAEQVDNNIQYSEYLAENIDNNINYTEYVAEHVDNNIAYSEYIAENLSDNQAYSKYIAESLDKTIDAINGKEKLNEDADSSDQRISDLKVANVDKYYEDDDSEFPPETNDEDLPEELDDLESNVEQAEEAEEGQEEAGEAVEEIGEVEDDVEALALELETETDEESILQPGTIVEFETEAGEQSGEIVSYNKEDGFAIVKINSDVQEEAQEEGQEEIQEEPVQSEEGQTQPVESQVQISDDEIKPEDLGQVAQPVDDEIKVHESKIIKINGKLNKLFEATVKETKIKLNESETKLELVNDNFIKKSISELIAEAKKRKASEELQPHFLLFLTEQNKVLYSKLDSSVKEKIIVAMNESNYTNERDVLNVIRETLDNTSKKTEEEILIGAIPDDLVDFWNKLNDTDKTSIIAQAKFYPNLVGSEPKMESFWNSRGLDKLVGNTKVTLLNENKTYVNDIKLSTNQIDRYINIFKNL